MASILLTPAYILNQKLITPTPPPTRTVTQVVKKRKKMKQLKSLAKCYGICLLYFTGCIIYSCISHNYWAAFAFSLATFFYVAFEFYKNMVNDFWSNERIEKLKSDVDKCNESCDTLREQMVNIYNLGVAIEEEGFVFSDNYYEQKKLVEELIILPKINIDDLNK